MTTHAVLQLNRVAATNVDAYNRSVITSASTTDLDNGQIFRLDSLSTTTGESEVWLASDPSISGSTRDNMWMAASPEVTTLVAGDKSFRGLSADPRDFYNVGGYVFDAFKPQPGDIITLTAEAFAGTKSTGSYANSGSTMYLLWASAQASPTGLSLICVATTYISIGTGGLGDTQRVTAYRMQVLAN
jgi:hypothetical protein